MKASIKPQLEITKTILSIRGQRVILDADLAKIYGVSTKRLNEQVKRNRERFPEDFMFQLTAEEKREPVAICDRFSSLKHSTSLPYAFTEHGALMAANVLNSPQAVSMCLFIIRAFVKMRESIVANHILEKRLSIIEKTLLDHDHALRDLMIKIRPLLLPPAEPPKRRIGFQSKSYG